VDEAGLPSARIRGLRAVELRSEDEPALQRFFEANPEYFIAVYGEPAGANEAREEIHGKLPAGWSFTKKWLLGYLDASGSLVAMANVVSDLLATGIWHIGLFIVATSRHGSGDAQRLCRGLEDWAASRGARWLRLGVVEGNVRAERFWKALGYAPVRRREGVELGKLTKAVHVMVKGLAGNGIDEYLALVPRDLPDPPSAP
jgi:GNAT superfamily N-acetyltransferase